jgi:hypothetical protein
MVAPGRLPGQRARPLCRGGDRPRVAAPLPRAQPGHRRDRRDLGKLILTACFVCDLGTALALGVLFASYNLLLVAFGVVIALVLVPLPRVLPLVLRTLGHPVSEPEVKLVFVLLLALGGLAAAARSEAVLPAYLFPALHDLRWGRATQAEDAA